MSVSFVTQDRCNLLDWAATCDLRLLLLKVGEQLSAELSGRKVTASCKSSNFDAWTEQRRSVAPRERQLGIPPCVTAF